MPLSFVAIQFFPSSMYWIPLVIYFVGTASGLLAQNEFEMGGDVRIQHIIALIRPFFVCYNIGLLYVVATCGMYTEYNLLDSDEL